MSWYKFRQFKFLSGKVEWRCQGAVKMHAKMLRTCYEQFLMLHLHLKNLSFSSRAKLFKDPSFFLFVCRINFSRYFYVNKQKNLCTRTFCKSVVPSWEQLLKPLKQVHLNLHTQSNFNMNTSPSNFKNCKLQFSNYKKINIIL